MRHIARQVVAVRDRQRLHQMPAGEVGAADIADLARTHEIVQRAERLLGRRQRVEAVQLEQVDMLGAEAPERRLHRVDQMVARAAHLVGALAGAEGGLGRDQHLVAPALDRRPQHLLGGACGIDVGAVEHREPGLEADIDQARRFGHVRAAPGLEELALAAEGAGAEAQHGHMKSGSSEAPVFHGLPPSNVVCCERAEA